MGKVVYSMSVSLDGYIETGDKKLDWCIIDEEFHLSANEEVKNMDALLYGRRMYDLMAPFWPYADQDPAAPPYVVEFSRLWREIPKVIFSRTLDAVEWNSKLVREDVAREVEAVKAQYEGDLGVGGAELAASLAHHDLIDEYRMYVHPVTLGGGTPYFPKGGNSHHLQLTEVRPFTSGVVFLTYQRE